MKKYIELSEDLIKSLNDNKIKFQEIEIEENEKGIKTNTEIETRLNTLESSIKSLVETNQAKDTIINQYKEILTTKNVEPEKEVKFQSAYIKSLKGDK